ncbi:MAG TPA: acetylornithine deacetylase [Silvibacterium sp.]|nr:acetylornithine deacetylase [Silvibacterium sp.]
MADVSAAVEILCELVATPSISALSNRPMVEAAIRVLEGAGWAARKFPYCDPDGVEKINVIASPAGQNATTEFDLAFVCHTDTVPFVPETWPHATTLTERDGFLHGCGACDVKGSLAGILAAIRETPVEKIARPVAVVLTADEEVGCAGAAHLLSAPTLRAKSVIVCEPTSLRPAVAGKGYGLAEFVVQGREAHSAFPREGASAIYAAAKMMVAIEQKGRSGKVKNDLFDPPWTTFNVGMVGGGTAKNIVPGECRFLVEWRPVPDEDPAAGLEWLRQLATETEREYPGCSVKIDGRRADAGFAYGADSQLAGRLTQLLDRKATGISFGSEATRFAKVADEVVVLGPGDMHTAHSDRECIAVPELQAWTECVRELLTR